MTLTLSQQLLLTTIRIETIVPDGISTGTDFFFSYKKPNNKHVPVIVTNKHVVKDAFNGKLRFSIKDMYGNPLWGQYYDLVLDDFESRWIMHPEEDIDLCILPIASIHREILKSHKQLNYITLNASNIPSNEYIQNSLSLIEDITVVGYPDGIWDSINNIPITRSGITATPLQFDFENMPKFLIDAAIFGGSSGSPVYIFNQGFYYSPDKGLVTSNRLLLVGIVYAVTQHTVLSELDGFDKIVAKTSIPNNIGVAIHARKLLDFERLL